jgi:phosphatidylglycerophosphatase A
LDRPDRLTSTAVVIATLGPVGHWPVGPGTLASALVTALWLVLPWPWAAWLAVVVLWTMMGVPLTDRAETVLGHDDGRIVIDEAAGMGLALLATPRVWTGALAAFALFRLFDILKPPPVGSLQRAPGGWGVMADDLAAGALTAVVVAAGFALWGR